MSMPSWTRVRHILRWPADLSESLRYRSGGHGMAASLALVSLDGGGDAGPYPGGAGSMPPVYGRPSASSLNLCAEALHATADRVAPARAS